MIPDSVLNEIQDKLNIVDVIEPFAPLKRTGKNFKGLCPFHEERTPSFTVTPDKQIFHCFGCGVSGNIFTFLMKFKKIDFREAAKELAEAAGVRLPEDEATRVRDSARNTLYEINRAAAEFYVRCQENAAPGSPIRRYTEKRGLTKDALLKFGIGYSPDAWDQLLQHLSKKYSTAMIEAAGLALPKNAGDGHYDRFRNRMMFPITDVKGNSLGFGARALDDAIPKYLNSPETEIYQKGRHLYGFHSASESVRREDRIIIVEGYMDQIACVLAGVTNTVAASGTALTLEQVRLIKRFTKNVTVLFDADKAGEAATLRGLDLIAQEDCEVRVAQMPQGNDPDSYIRKMGADQFRAEVIGGAKTLFDYKFGMLSAKYDATKIEEKVRIAMDMLETLRKIPNEVLKAGLVRRLADELKLPEAALVTEMQKRGAGVSAILKSQPAAGAAPAAGMRTTEASIRERMLIGLFLNYPHCLERAKVKIAPSDFDSDRARMVVELIYGVQNADELKLDKFLNRMHGDPEASRLVVQAARETEHGDHEKAFGDCVQKFEEERARRKRDDLQREIKAAELGGDMERLKTLLAEFNVSSRKKPAGESFKR